MLIRCKNLSSSENPIYFMMENSETQCWTFFHLIWSVCISLPNFLLWTIVLPFVLFRILKQKIKIMKDPISCAQYSFIYAGLKLENYYW